MRCWLPIALLCSLVGCAVGQDLEERNPRPNLLWIWIEDLNPWFRCYGEALVETPNVDGLAARGVRFTRAYMPSAVCSSTRSAVITGVMQTTTGTHNHRSSRAVFRGESMGEEWDAISLPADVATLPERFRATGYFTFNQGKTDYNFAHDLDALYDLHDGGMTLEKVDLAALWRAADDRPWFGQIQLRGGKVGARAEVDREAVTVPPYYPDTELVREEIAHHLDCVRRTDREIGRILDALEVDGLARNTVVMVFSDHGFRMLRHKQFLYEGGIRVPLVVAGPGAPVGQVRSDLVSGIDLAATSLALAGIEVPDSFEGRDLLAASYVPRRFVVAARDRCDYSIDRIRAIVTERYKYLRNGFTDRPYMQPQYRDPRPVTQELRRLAADGQLDAVQLAFFGGDRPAEELYDLRADPHEILDLASDPAHAEILERHRALLDGWIAETGDRGQLPESEAGLRCVLRRWGDRCVNPEYEPVRPSSGGR